MMKSRLLKRSLAIAACCMASATAALADGMQPALVVWNGDTELYSFYVSNEPVLKVSNGNAIVQSDGTWGAENAPCYYSIPMSETANYKITLEQRDYTGDFGQGVPTSIKETPTAVKRPAFSVKNGLLSVAGLQAGETLLVFAADGRKFAQAKADANGQASVSLRQALGTVVVKAGHVSFKLMVK